MNDKKLIWWGMFVGSTLGGFVPSLWHASMLSLWGFVFSAVGGIVGIWVGWRISHGG